MFKLDNFFIKVIAFTVVLSFSFTTVAMAGDEQFLKSIAALDYGKNEETVILAESTVLVTTTQEVDTTFIKINNVPATSSFIVPKPLSSQEVKTLVPADAQYSINTKTIKAGDSFDAILAIILLVASAGMIYGVYTVIEAYSDRNDP